MDPEWTITDGRPVPRWKIGPRIWRANGEWRLKLYRPWSNKRLIEVQSTKFLWNVYILGLAAGWWKEVKFNETPPSSQVDASPGQGLEETQEEN